MTSARSVVTRLALALSLALRCAVGQGWVDVTPSNPISGDARLCYDPVNAKTWAFTGNQAWSWDGQAWNYHAALSPAGGLSRAFWHDATQAVWLIYGTYSSSSYSFSMYSWDGVSATNVPQSGLAVGQFFMPERVAYDPVRNEVVYIEAGVMHVFDGVSWSSSSPLVMPQLGAISLLNSDSVSVFFDATRGRIVMTLERWAGTPYVSTYPEYWEWSGTNWVQGYPSPRFGRLGIVASAPGRGINIAQTFWLPATGLPQPRMFSVDSGQFTEMYLTTWPSWRVNHSLVYDEVRDRFILHGGNGLSDTWELDLGPTASYSTFGAGCQGAGGTPALAPQAGDLPYVNTTFTVQVSGLPWNAPALMFFGFSNTAYGGVPLPANLAIFGAPQCNLLVSGDLLLPVTSVLGLGIWSVAIPNQPGITFYNQAIVLDPGANAFGLTLSNAGEAVVGQ